MAPPLPGAVDPNGVSLNNNSNVQDGFPPARAPTPGIFRVSFSDDGSHLKFDIGFDQFAVTQWQRYTINSAGLAASYRVYFAPISLASSTIIADPTAAATAFKQAVLVDDIPAGGNGGVVSFLNRLYFGKDGWFWATAMSLYVTGAESKPTQPIRAPNQATGSDSVVPLDVGDPQVQLSPVMVNGKTVVLVNTTAIIPNSSSFAGYQIYLSNYFGNFNMVEDAFIQNVTDVSLVKGTALPGNFNLEPDTFPLYDVGTVNLVAGNNTITANVTVPPAVWSRNWITGRYITVIDAQGNYDYLQLQLVTEGTPPSCLVASTPWTTSAANCQYAITAPDFSLNLAARQPPHPVTMYFVSVSKGGTRRPDPQNAPHVVLPFGISAYLSPPLTPSNFTAKLVGITVNLTWSLALTTATADNTIKSFNIYKYRFGTTAPGVVPFTHFMLYQTVPFDPSITTGGLYSFVDRNFNVDPTSGTWDFNPVAPAYYIYWISSVNVDGLESPSAAIDGSQTNVLMIGNTGGENDPSIYRDNQWNRNWNAQFKNTVAVNTAMTILQNAAYGPAAAVDNGQPTFGLNAAVPAQAGSNTDDFLVWEYAIGGTGVIPKWVSAGAGLSSGECLLDTGLTGSTGADFSVVVSSAVKSKYINKENVCISVYCKAVSNTGTPTGGLNLQMALFNQPTGLEPVASSGLFIPGGNITSTYTRFYATLSLPDNTAVVYTHIHSKYFLNAEAKQKLQIMQPMVNGGNVCPTWTAVLNPVDAPGGGVSGGSSGGGSGGSGGYTPPPKCVTGGTKILTPQGWREARSIKKGDSVLSWNDSRWVQNFVLKCEESTTREVYTILVVDGLAVPRTLQCTGSHPIRTRSKFIRRWIKVHALNAGDEVFCTDGEAVFLSRIAAIEKATCNVPEPIYTFTMERKPQNYVAEGFLCHNKPIGPG